MEYNFDPLPFKVKFDDKLTTVGLLSLDKIVILHHGGQLEVRYSSVC